MKSSNTITSALLFAGKIILVLAAGIATLRIIGIAIAFSRWTGALSLCIVALALYATAQYWLRWLPGLLVFGVINGVVAASTHRAPLNYSVVVSTGLAILLSGFYAAGTVVSYYFGDARLSVFDRCAWLVYVSAMIVPAFITPQYGGVTKERASIIAVALVTIGMSFAIRRMNVLGRHAP